MSYNYDDNHNDDYGGGDYGNDYGDDDYGDNDYGGDDYGYGSGDNKELDEYDNFNDEYTDTKVYKAGRDAWDRTGVGGNVGPAPLNAFERSMQDPLERFQIQVDAVSRNLNSKQGISINQITINLLVEKARKLKKVQYKNATAYILGYLASKGGRDIEEDHVKDIFAKYLPYVKENFVRKPDIIRYARLWMILD